MSASLDAGSGRPVGSMNVAVDADPFLVGGNVGPGVCADVTLAAVAA